MITRSSALTPSSASSPFLILRSLQPSGVGGQGEHSVSSIASQPPQPLVLPFLSCAFSPPSLALCAFFQLLLVVFAFE